jgi:hypothetical protein
VTVREAKRQKKTGRDTEKKVGLFTNFRMMNARLRALERLTIYSIFYEECKNTFHSEKLNPIAFANIDKI